MDAECPECHYRAARWEINASVGDPMRVVVSCGRCHHSSELEGEAAAAWLTGSDLGLPMHEWVVILRNGQRLELEATWWEASWDDQRGLRHTFSTLPVRREWPGDQVVVVQRRAGHLLEQVWPKR